MQVHQITSRTLAQFCRDFGIGRTKAYEEINAGRLKARKVGSRFIISEKDAEAWLESLPPFPIRGG